MHIFMTGGTGFVGTTLSRELALRGHQVMILTRPGESFTHNGNGSNIDYLTGDPSRPDEWIDRAAEYEVFINLAGASIFSRWNKERKRAIRESRLATTGNLVKAIGKRKQKKTTLISTSAVGYYGFHGDERLVEKDPPGRDFLASVAADWEAAAMEAAQYGARVVLCRFGIVLGRNGGALGQMIPLFRFWMGSPLGSGNQWFSWIHEKDLVHIYRHVLDHEELKGPINCSSPNPLRNRELTGALGKALGKPVFLPAVPSFALKLMLGEFGTVLLEGQRVYPEKLLQSGFEFAFPTIEEALRDIIT